MALLRRPVPVRRPDRLRLRDAGGGRDLRHPARTALRRAAGDRGVRPLGGRRHGPRHVRRDAPAVLRGRGVRSVRRERRGAGAALRLARGRPHGGAARGGAGERPARRLRRGDRAGPVVARRGERQHRGRGGRRPGGEPSRARPAGVHAQERVLMFTDEQVDAAVRALSDPERFAGAERALSELAPQLQRVLTHGHGDHIGDTEDIAKRTGATVVAVPEITNELSEAGVENVVDPNLGGTVKFDWGWVKLVPAWHTSTTPKGSSPGVAAGLLIGIGGKTVYHLGDTALFSDMKLIAGRGDPIDVALMCIGGHYTMDRLDAVVAAEYVEAGTVIPCHYDTFPVIETDAQAFKSEVESQTSSKVEVLQPGE